MARSTLVVMPTGCGKTIVFGHAARDWNQGRVMILAHREELIFQAAQKVGAVCKEQCGIEMADLQVIERTTSKTRVVVSSVQTLNSTRNGKRRMEKFDPMEFGLLVIDEAHHSTAATYRRVVDWFGRNPDLKLLGVTATPDRADEEALGQIYDSVAFEYGIADAVGDGWLVPIEQQFVHVEGLDLSQCKSDKHDLKDADVARVMEQEAMLHKVVSPTIELAGDKPTLVFSASVAHAHKMAEIFNRHKPNSAIAIDGTTDKESRREELKRFSRGEFQYLCNCGVFLEGFDEPRIAVVAMARPTKSRALYAQAIGRGTRPLPGIVDGLESNEARLAAIGLSDKPTMLTLDFVGNSGRHKLVCTADILGGNESDEVVDLAAANAKEKSARGQKSNMTEELEEAKKQLEEAARERKRQEAAMAEKLAGIRAKARFSAKSVNPFDVFDRIPKREPGWHKGRKPTPKMIAALERFKVDDKTIDGLSFHQAGEMLGILTARAAAGLCTLRQAKLIGKFGYPTDMSFTEAKQVIDKLAANNWQRRD